VEHLKAFTTPWTGRLQLQRLESSNSKGIFHPSLRVTPASRSNADGKLAHAAMPLRQRFGIDSAKLIETSHSITHGRPSGANPDESGQTTGHVLACVHHCRRIPSSRALSPSPRRSEEIIEVNVTSTPYGDNLINSCHGQDQGLYPPIDLATN